MPALNLVRPEVPATLLVLALSFVAATAGAAAGEPKAAAKPDLLAGDFQTSASGLKWRDIAPGAGPALAAGGIATVHYTGWLTDGTQFDSSVDRRPFTVKNVGEAGVIRGWNEGLIGMRSAGKRRLVIPPELGYGAAGSPPVIPPGATLVFDIELLDFQQPPPPTPMPEFAKLKLVDLSGGLRMFDMEVGKGSEVVRGATVTVHYTGWLASSGKKFDSSLDRGTPFPVTNIGAGGVIRGWNEGVPGMRVGGKRLLVIPPDMAYGDRGFPPIIPSGSTLVFLVEAVSTTGP